MTLNKKNNKFVSYLIILLTLFVLIIVTKDKLTVLQENLDLRETYSIELEEKKEKLKWLNDLKNELANSSENIDKYIVEIKEDEIIDYIYSYIEKTNTKEGLTIVKSISISNAVDTEIGFKETTINLNLRVPNENRLKHILDFLTSSNSKYNFFINSFSFPYWSTEWSFNISVPLKVLYK